MRAKAQVLFLSGAAGLIVMMEVHGTAPGLIVAPGWLLCGCAALVVTAIGMTYPARRVIVAFAVGAAIGFLPLRVEAPSGAVLSHTVAFARDADLFDALQQLDDEPERLVGKRISVTGLWQPAIGHAPSAVYRTIMACCLADAINVGFDVSPIAGVRLIARTRVRVTGDVSVLDVGGEIRYQLTRADVVAARR